MSDTESPVEVGLRRAIEAYKGVRQMADALGVTEQAVRGYRRIPESHVATVERDTGIPGWELRPDLYWPLPPVDSRATGD